MRFNYYLWSIALLAAGVLSFSACKHEPAIPLEPEIHFSSDVQPLLAGNCSESGCHGSREFRLQTYDDLQRRNLLVAGKPFQSELYLCITRRTTPMPPDRVMPAAAIRTIEIWILQGAKNN